MRAVRSVLALLLLAALPAVGGAQSSTTGAIQGSVRSADGATLFQTQLTVRRLRSGLPQILETDAEGRWVAALLVPGEYEVLAEELGYQPVVVGPIPVRAGRRTDVNIVLDPVEGVVEAPDRRRFPAALTGGSRPGRSQVFSAWEREALPLRTGDLGELLGGSTLAEPGLEVEGLPSSLSTAALDGIAIRPISLDPLELRGGLPPLLLARGALSEVELLAGRQNLEWPAAAGGVLAVSPRSAARTASGEVSGDWGSDATATEDGPPYTSWWGAASGGGAVAGDSAHVWLDVRGVSRERPLAYLPRGSEGLVDGLTSAGLDLAPLQGRNLVRDERLRASAMFDWSFAERRSVRINAMYAEGTTSALPSDLGTPVPVSATGREFATTATAIAGLAPSAAVEVRLGFNTSNRDYRGTGLGTRFDDAVVSFLPGRVRLGGDGALPAELQRSGFAGQGTFHLWTDDHHVKLGGGYAGAWHEQLRGDDRAGRYLFGTAGDYDAGTGAYYRLEGGVSRAEFSTQEVYFFGQDTWRLAAGLDLLTGLRYGVEFLPTDDVLRNNRWGELTGINTGDVDRVAGVVGFMAGFEWDVQEEHRWLVRADGGVQAGGIRPDLLGEALTRDGRIEAYGQVGDVNDETAAVSLGPVLTILAPSMQPPVTTRASFGISRVLGWGTALHLSGVVRQTDNLPRRRDLNLRTDPTLRDQYDRPLYGPLEQAGGVVQAVPGENRRFGEFDAVSAISTDASSTYWGLTAMLERDAGDIVRFSGSYTYSRTADDWTDPLTGRSFLVLSPFPNAEGLENWREGTSWFDVPHRVAATVELTAPFAPVFVGGAFRLSSGRPFTPGFGPGIDANADGVSGNDPVFVDEQLDGMEPLLERFDCLRSSTGRFVERNACRLPERTTLDAWVGVAIPSVGGVAGELRIQGLGIIADGAGLYDTALLQVDRSGTLTTDPSTGVVTVPLAVNGRFGQNLIPGSEPRRVRVSLRLRF